MPEWVVTSSVFILIIIAVRQIFIGKISPRMQYSLWFLVMLRLLCPVMIMGSSFSILNIAEYIRQDIVEREAGTDWQTPLENIIVEIIGMNQLLLEYHEELFSLLCKLEGLLTLTGENDFMLFRKNIFECLGIMNGIKKCL